MSYYAQDTLVHGVTLHRYYVGSSADELGDIEFWHAPIRELHPQMPFSTMWGGLDIHVRHMGHRELTRKMKAGEATLKDFDLSTPGYQVAAGLFWHKDKLELAVFPPNWTPEAVAFYPVDEAARERARNTISHEIGHYYASLCGYKKNANYVQRRITEEFNLIRPKQAANEDEDFAEVYRALCGMDKARGYFSDNKAFVPSPKLLTLIKTAHWLEGNLVGKTVTDLQFRDTDVCWREWELKTDWVLFVPYTRWVTSGWWSVGRDWVKKKL